MHLLQFGDARTRLQAALNLLIVMLALRAALCVVSRGAS